MKKSLFQPTKQSENCPQCGSALHIKQGKKGLFLGCSTFPKCDFLKPLHPQYESKTLKDLTESCPKCGHFLQVKQGIFGLFIGCSNYPNCDFVVHEQQEQQEENLICPDCKKGELVARRGRQGKTFYGCNQYPHCKFTLPAKPQQIDCPKCDSKIAILKKQTESHRTFICANKTCKYQFDN